MEPKGRKSKTLSATGFETCKAIENGLQPLNLSPVGVLFVFLWSSSSFFIFSVQIGFL